MTQRIYLMLQKAEPGDHLSKLYDVFISIVAVLSIVPLMFKDTNAILSMIDKVTVYILFLDYVLRWITHDYIHKTHSKWSFLIYPFTPFAIIDLVSILPSIGLLGNGLRILRMLRIFKVLHYAKSFVFIVNVFKKERKTLGYVLIIALSYIFVSALAMFANEPETFDTFFHALYWATTALTTVGYGDIFPHSAVGQLISMVSSLFGIAIIALPAGVVTAGFMEQIDKDKEERVKLQEEKARLAAEKLIHEGGKNHANP